MSDKVEKRVSKNLFCDTWSSWAKKDLLFLIIIIIVIWKLFNSIWWPTQVTTQFFCHYFLYINYQNTKMSIIICIWFGLIECYTRGIHAEMHISEYITHLLTNFDESNVRVNFYLIGINHFLCYDHLKSVFIPQKVGLKSYVTISPTEFTT